MAEEQAVIKRMEQYAKAAARKMLQKYGLGQDQDRHEDISQTLILAGWEVWRNTGEWAKARHRMVDRATLQWLCFRSSGLRGHFLFGMMLFRGSRFGCLGSSR